MSCAEISLLQAVVLGVVQGLSEFLPISSSAHLILVPWLLGWLEHSLTFDLALHLGTSAALLAYFWREWVTLGQAVLLGVNDSGVGGAAGPGGAPTAWPQVSQKRARGRSLVEQRGQVGFRRLPHDSQNAAVSRLSWPQAEQRIGRRPSLVGGGSMRQV